MKIYTRTGDKGETSIIGGKRVPKNHIRIEAYGTVDELISFIGLLRDQITDKHSQVFLLNIQDKLMVIAAILSSEDNNPGIKLPMLFSTDVSLLESEIDRIENDLPPLASFILPGGHPIVSLCHVVRSVCRRAERIIVNLALNLHLPEIIIEYMNRLSDYFFVLARKLSYDFGAEEIEWQPKL